MQQAARQKSHTLGARKLSLPSHDLAETIIPSSDLRYLTLVITIVKPSQPSLTFILERFALPDDVPVNFSRTRCVCTNLCSTLCAAVGQAVEQDLPVIYRKIALSRPSEKFSEGHPTPIYANGGDHDERDR
jgi:hypothetical protein